MALKDKCTYISEDINDILVLSFTEVYPAEISTGSRILRPEPASMVRSLTRARTHVSFSFDANLLSNNKAETNLKWHK